MRGLTVSQTISEGSPGQVTIAFTLSFDHKDPVVAQTIADELLSLYLAENSRSRQERASETTEFLAKEADKLAQQITELEAKLVAPTSGPGLPAAKPIAAVDADFGAEFAHIVAAIAEVHTADHVRTRRVAPAEPRRLAAAIAVATDAVGERRAGGAHVMATVAAVEAHVIARATGRRRSPATALTTRRA